jgi:UDP-N-acetylglucosamine--N-acetylmuramyl-(pentapeptide) pyrophosphoryl-undecaprenol N-acetylglucosamine transferase
LAVVGELGEKADVLWVGSEPGMERRLVEREGLPFRAVPAAGLHGVGLRTMPGNALRLARGALASRVILREFEPDVLFFTGGFVGIPVALAGWRRPMVTYVPDLEPALAQRLIGRFAHRVCVTAETSLQFYRSSQKVRVTGYPHRFEKGRPDPATARQLLGLRADKPVLLVLGGSRGARSINLALWENLEAILDMAQILHVTGELDWHEYAAGADKRVNEDRVGYRPYPYLHEEMGEALAAADLVLSRAGASILGEYPAFGIPSILVPYPHTWRYQESNARYMVDRGAALMLEDDQLTERLLPVLHSLLGDPDRLREMAALSKELDHPGAAGRVAGQILEIAGEAPA